MPLPQSLPQDGPLQQAAIPADQVQYYFSVAQNQTPTPTSNIQVQNPQPTVASTTQQQQANQSSQLVTSQPQLQVSATLKVLLLIKVVAFF